MNVMRALRGRYHFPVVELSSRTMKTAYGQKQRPEFEIIDWRDLSGGDGAALLGHGPPLIEHQKIESAPATPTKSATTKKNVGKDVKPVSVSEEINDSLPPDLAPPI